MAGTLVEVALLDVLAEEGTADLEQAAAADLDNYARHFSKLPGSQEGLVTRQAVEDHMSELLQGAALRRVISHVIGEGSTAATISRQQFLAISHIVYAVLRQAQDRMFEADALVEVAPPPLPPNKAWKHIRCDSIGSWKIEAARQQQPASRFATGGGGDARSSSGLALDIQGPLEAGCMGAKAPLPVSLISPSMADARPMERGISALSAEGLAEEAGGAAADAVATDVSKFEARLQGLLQQLAEQQAAAAALEGREGAAAQQSTLAQLRQLEAQVRQALRQQQQLMQAASQGGAAEGPVPASWQAFTQPSPKPPPELGGADVFAAFEPGNAQGRAAEAWLPFAEQLGEVPETPEHLVQSSTPIQQAGGGSGFAQHPYGYAAAPASPDVASPPQRGQAAGQEIIGEMLAQMQLSPAYGPLQPTRLSPHNAHCALPASTPAGLEPLSAADRERCEAVYVAKRYEQLRGMPQGAAHQIYSSKSQLPPELFAHAWALADADRDGVLNKAEFCVFMCLLRTASKGQPLPLKLSWEEFAALLGPPAPIRVDVGKLRGALRPGPGGGVSITSSQQRRAAEPQGEDGSDCEDGFESVTTMSVGSSLRSRRSSAVVVAPGAVPTAAQRRERVKAWSDGDACHTGLEVTIHSADVHYSKQLDRPFFSVSVRDAQGRLVEMPQDTPPGHYSGSTITAGHVVALQTQLQQLPSGSVLYIAIKHWKSSDKKFSVLAWGYAAIDQLVDTGPMASRVRQGRLGLHLYRKPVAEGPAALSNAKRLMNHPSLHVSLRGLL